MTFYNPKMLPLQKELVSLLLSWAGLNYLKEEFTLFVTVRTPAILYILHYISSRDKAMHWHVAKLYSVVYYQTITRIKIHINNMLINDRSQHKLSIM